MALRSVTVVLVGRWVDELARRGITSSNGGAIRHDVIARLLMRSTPIRRKVANTGAVADYTYWCMSRYGTRAYLPRREKLWARIASLLPANVRGIEFGVAHGYSTAWWLDRLPASATWEGFDRFTGLPRAWRGLGEGTFDNDGQPPPMDDPRVTWHVGDIEDTISELDVSRDERPWLVIFDLDIYEPSLIAWQHIAKALRPGDFLYFDEAFDRDERHLLDHWVLTSGLEFKGVGWTPTALALRIV